MLKNQNRYVFLVNFELGLGLKAFEKLVLIRLSKT